MDRSAAEAEIGKVNQAAAADIQNLLNQADEAINGALKALDAEAGGGGYQGY